MIERRAIEAGLLYCAMVFGAGFVLGVARTFWVAPLSGEFVAVLLEAPIILAAAWGICGWVAERLEVPENFLDRLIMGGVALALMVVAEAFIAMLANGQTLTHFLVSAGKSSVVLGLLAQLGFAIFPMLRRRNVGR
jgi:hypothetical protein